MINKKKRKFIHNTKCNFIADIEAAKPAAEQITSSSSLIVNVLNELSESVACKLAGEASSEEEKEPLNAESAEKKE